MWQAACTSFSKIPYGEHTLPRGDKSSYTSKQKRMAEHIEEGYEKRGLGNRESARRAWATVNKETGGGRKRSPARKRKGASSASRTSRMRTSSRGTSSRMTPGRKATSRRSPGRTTTSRRSNSRKK